MSLRTSSRVTMVMTVRCWPGVIVDDGHWKRLGLEVANLCLGAGCHDAVGSLPEPKTDGWLRCLGMS